MELASVLLVTNSVVETLQGREPVLFRLDTGPWNGWVERQAYFELKITERVQTLMGPSAVMTTLISLWPSIINLMRR